MKSRYMTVQDLTHELGISRTTAYQLIRKINHTKIGRRILVAEEDLTNYLQKHTEIRSNTNQNNNIYNSRSNIMRNYFNTKHIDAIEIEEVADLLHHADMKPDKYIRIVMDEDFSFIDIRGEEEVILQAVVFVEDRLGNFSRYDFEQGDTEHCLYMALDPEIFIAVSI